MEKQGINLPTIQSTSQITYMIKKLISFCKAFKLDLDTCRSVDDQEKRTAGGPFSKNLTPDRRGIGVLASRSTKTSCCTDDGITPPLSPPLSPPQPCPRQRTPRQRTQTCPPQSAPQLKSWRLDQLSSRPKHRPRAVTSGYIPAISNNSWKRCENCNKQYNEQLKISVHAQEARNGFCSGECYCSFTLDAEESVLLLYPSPSKAREKGQQLVGQKYIFNFVAEPSPFLRHASEEDLSALEALDSDEEVNENKNKNNTPKRKQTIDAKFKCTFESKT